MIHRHFLSCLILALLTLPSVAQNTGDAPPPPQILGEPVPTPPAPAEPRLPLADWISDMKTRMPTYICQDQGEWLGCFDMAPEECEQIAADISALCLDILAENMPAELVQAEAGRWGVEAARCFNLTFFNLHQDALSDHEECQNPPPHLR